MNKITLIVPYYRNPLMLREQLKNWNSYPDDWHQIIVVDDGSPEPAIDHIHVRSEKLRLYRINVDIPWNRGGARNLGAHVAGTDWIIHVDIDHVLPPQAANILLNQALTPGFWYRFPRYRVGKADATRRKDKISPDANFGPIHPHVDSYLITKQLYWKIGGYNEDYSGILGGGGAFLKQLERTSGAPKLLPPPICLNVYTRHAIADASDLHLSRDPTGYSARKRKVPEMTPAKNPLRFPWERVL